MSKKTKKGVQNGKEVNTDISREEKAYNVAIVFSNILQDYLNQDVDVLSGEF